MTKAIHVMGLKGQEGPFLLYLLSTFRNSLTHSNISYLPPSLHNSSITVDNPEPLLQDDELLGSEGGRYDILDE